MSEKTTKIKWVTSLLLGLIIVGSLVAKINKLEDKLERVRSTARLGVYGTYCNNYRNRALEHFVRNKNWDGFVMFSAVCNLHDTAEVLDAVKHRGWKPTYNDVVFRTYDPFFTGKGYHGKNQTEQIKQIDKELKKEALDIIKKMGIKESIQDED